MKKKQQVYVIDTNILVDYIDILPGENGRRPEKPTVDLTEAHIVIPTAVVRELSHFKRESTDRGKVARVALRRLREITEGRIESIRDIYNMKAPLFIEWGGASPESFYPTGA